MNLQEFVVKMEREVSDLDLRLNQGSVALLTWFLINYYRLDEETAQSAICDGPGDKGIDGIYIDHMTQEIVIFQSKYGQNAMSNQGDNDLRNLVGAGNWFRNQATVQNLLADPHTSASLSALVTREKVEQYVESYSKNLVFVTNRRFDHNAVPYLNANVDQLKGYDIDQLFAEYTYIDRGDGVNGTYVFNVDLNNIIEYATTNNLKAVLFPVSALEITNLDGIQNRELFEKNVRYSLGRTRVSKDINKTLGDQNERENFFLYHNGITMICRNFNLDRNNSTITIQDYSIVNGCQSTVAFYGNRNQLNPEIKVLLRIVEVGENNVISDRITQRTNNQNSISLKDLKSNDRLQQTLQANILQATNNQVFYKIKPGETGNNNQRIIDNDFVAQMITAFDLKDPSIVHQKTQIFTENYNKIFHRHINADYIVIMLNIFDAISNNKDQIEDLGIRSYRVTLFFFMYVIRVFLDDEPLGREIVADPTAFKNNHPRYPEAIVTIFSLLVKDFNFLIRQMRGGNPNFDYKNTLRNAQSVREIADILLRDQQKNLVRYPENSISAIIRSLD